MCGRLFYRRAFGVITLCISYKKNYELRDTMSNSKAGKMYRGGKLYRRGRLYRRGKLYRDALSFTVGVNKAGKIYRETVNNTGQPVPRR